MRSIDVCQVLILAETIASELSATALDRSADLSAPERRSLIVLALGIERAAAEATQVKPRSAWADGLLLRSLSAMAGVNDNAAILPDKSAGEQKFCRIFSATDGLQLRHAGALRWHRDGAARSTDRKPGSCPGCRSTFSRAAAGAG